MANNAAATSRRLSSTRAGPLTETQLADVRAAVDRVRGSGALSVKVHGVIVFLDKQECAPRKLPKPPPMTPAAGSDGAATTRKPDELLSSRRRRSRRRLEAHIALNAAANERAPHPRAGESEATTLPSPNPSCPPPAAPKGALAPSTSTSSRKAQACHPQRAERQPAAPDPAWNMRSGPRGAPAWVTGAGGKGRAPPTPAAQKTLGGNKPASSAHMTDSSDDEGPPLPQDVMYAY